MGPRSLHVNHEDTSFPQHRPKFGLGLNQVIANYYDIELIEFGNPALYQPEPAAPDPHAEDDPFPKDPHPRGLRGKKQYFLYDNRPGTLCYIEPGFDVGSPPWSFDFQGTDNNNRTRVDPMYVYSHLIILEDSIVVPETLAKSNIP
jgi:hypothetical protein